MFAEAVMTCCNSGKYFQSRATDIEKKVRVSLTDLDAVLGLTVGRNVMLPQ